MTKILLLLTGSLCFGFSSYSQLDNHNVVSAGGGTYKGSDISLDWTLGETFITTEGTGDLLLTQGFHQPNLIIKEVLPSLVKSTSKVTVRIAPNPVVSELSIYLEQPSEEKASIQLLDMFGRVMYQLSPSNKNYITINLSNYQQGTYFLQVKSDKGQLIKAFKVIKLR